jgi:hypothetical protein
MASLSQRISFLATRVASEFQTLRATLWGTNNLADNAVTFAKLQNLSSGKLLGRSTGGSGDAEEISLGANLSFAGNVLNAVGAETNLSTSMVPLTDDFVIGALETGELGNLGWEYAVAGTGAAVTQSTGSASNPGQVTLNKGTTATGTAYLRINPTAMTLGGGKLGVKGLLQIPTLPTVADDFIVRFGYGDGTTAEPVDGAYFELNRGVNTDRYIIKTSNNSGRASFNSTVVCDTNFHSWRIEVNSVGTLVDFYLDGALVGSLNTQIPTAAARVAGFFLQIIGVAGTLSRTVVIDVFEAKKDLSTSRNFI